MGNFYGHHSSPDVPDPNNYYTKEETVTLVETVSANLDEHSELKGLTIGDDHTQYHNDTRGDVRYYQQGQVDLLTMEASANAFNQVETNIYDNPDWNNGWYKDVAFFTTITSAAPSAAYQIEAIPGNTFVKVHIVGLGGLGFTKHAAYTLQAFFAVPGGTPPVEKIGSTTVLFEQESDANWFADIDMDVSDNYINILVQGDLVDWIVTVEWLIQPIVI